MNFGCSFRVIFVVSCCRRSLHIEARRELELEWYQKDCFVVLRDFFQMELQCFRAFSNGLLLKLINFSWWLKNNVMFVVIADHISFKPVVPRIFNWVILLFDSILEFCNSCKILVRMSFYSALLYWTVVVRSNIFDGKSSIDSIMLTNLSFANLDIL